MNETINKRVEALREVMRREGIDAFIFPSTDPHNGEYVPEHWEGRKWISGFNGSAGTAVVTIQDAALWTDSRYFLAAEEQLRGTPFSLMKERVEGTPSITRWLGLMLAAVGSPVVGIDGTVNSAAFVEALITELRAEGGITVRTNLDPLARIWADRPPVPQSEVAIHPLEYAGEPCRLPIGTYRQNVPACGRVRQNELSNSRSNQKDYHRDRDAQDTAAADPFERCILNGNRRGLRDDKRQAPA